jgi:hypothetical protein
MSRIAHFLLLLVLAQFDSVWALAAVEPPSEVAEENDEYWLSQRRPLEVESSARKTPLFAGRKYYAPVSSIAHGPVPCDNHRGTLTGSSALYLFMSMQI